MYSPLTCAELFSDESENEDMTGVLEGVYIVYIMCICTYIELYIVYVMYICTYI